jgi:hypothetical protein
MIVLITAVRYTARALNSPWTHLITAKIAAMTICRMRKRIVGINMERELWNGINVLMQHRRLPSNAGITVVKV